jgi:hypothetical protein
MPAKTIEVTWDAIRALVPGDVFYWRRQRFTFTRHESDPTQPRVFGVDRKGMHWSIGLKFLGDFERIVPKHRVQPRRMRRNFAFAETDGGRKAEGFDWETNDCTVRALSVLTQCSYTDAHSHMKFYGRRDKRGANFCIAVQGWIRGMERIKDVTRKHFPEIGHFPTVGQALKSGRLPARCVLSVHKHVIAVVNNVVQDSFKVGAKAKICAVYAVVDTSRPWQTLAQEEQYQGTCS